MRSNNSIISLVVASFLVFNTAFIQADQYKNLDPLETVKNLVSRTISQIKTIKEQGEFDHKKMREFIRNEALQRFDMRSITKSLMGDYYARANDTEQDQFADAFSNRLLQIYSNSLKDFDKQQIKFTRNFQFLNNGRALVRTLLVFENNTRVPVEYYLRKVTNIGWLIYDISIDGMSVIATYRPNFKKQFDSKSIDTVIRELNRSNQYLDSINDKSINSK